jgi:HEAT repeat protein
VCAALTDPHPNVLYAAILSLLELAHADALPELAALIAAARGRAREAVLRACFHATNYLNINPSDYAGVDALLDALDDALHDSFPGARMAAFWPLAWMRHERATALLSRAYTAETNSAVKAHLVRVTVGLMTPISEDLLRDALTSPDAEVQQAAQRIMDNRARTGVVLEYDEFAPKGKGFRKPSLSR